MNGKTRNDALSRRIYRSRYEYLFLLPALISVAVFCYRPMIGVIMAFQNYTPRGGLLNSEWVGLAHFQNFLTNRNFYNALKNTMVISVLGFLVGFPLPIVLALMFSEVRFIRFKKITQTVSYLPHFISWVIISGVLYKILNHDYGSVNLLIVALGGKPIDFLKDKDFFIPMLITVSIWKELGWNSIIYLAAITGVDVQLYEAATVDGAGRFKKIFYITLPGIYPTIALLLILSAGSIFGSAYTSFDAIFNLRNPYVADAANVLEYYIYREGIYNRNFSYATAVGMALSIVSFSCVFTANSISRKLQGYGVF